MAFSHSILFVCTGNICRSPTAHGVMRQKVRQMNAEQHIRIDSAGTHNFHPGRPPDERSQMHALRRGYDLSDLAARQIQPQDFKLHDLILVMDWDNLTLTQSLAPFEHYVKIRRLTEFCQNHVCPIIPDPYHGGSKDFEHVLDLIEDACDGLLKRLTPVMLSVA